MIINYEFIPEYKSTEKLIKTNIISYAGKLLESIGGLSAGNCETVIVTLDDEGRPVVYQASGRLFNALDFELDMY